jgi:UDP-N-acetylmuramoylalanine--D-glutamate ligase
VTEREVDVSVVSSWTGKNVTVIGFAIEGEDMARYFQESGANVLVSTTRIPSAMQEKRIELESRGVRFHVGLNDPADVAGADLVCVTQGVPQNNPAVAAAREQGIPVRSMTSMFFDTYPGPICGITGSSGKTTTTSLVDAVFGAAGREHVLGGNIGLGLMSLLDNAVPERWAVLEVSHTQLILTGRSPRVAAVTNVTPNHLDQFSWEEYVGLKRRIFELQGRDDHVVFNLDDPVSRTFRHEANGRVFLFSIEGDHACDGAFVKDGAVFWRGDGRTEKVIGVDEVPLRGQHNVANVAAATAVASACEIGPEAVAEAVRGFKAPAHRLELVASIRGVSYYNDSIATAPERTLAALRSFSQPIVLLLGGRDKNLPLEDMLDEAKRKCRGVVCFGEAGPILADAAERTGVAIGRADDLPEALRMARMLAREGDIVLLSPACTSFDAYENFEQRGEEFGRLVRQIEMEGEGR